ncbi:hypothetical protein CYY_000800 [Polysphondylium violaceum]|uniref:Sec20 C-terminal domain-containing protein n=1 Tax=Polysphondylium violaceum TaxID=133409 RepID=A0A8J4Q465_9MYCE|nr:hypothetical protein CYY_000800 [Polysphondylium violaceum]
MTSKNINHIDHLNAQFKEINQLEYSIRDHIKSLSDSSSILETQNLNTHIKSSLETLNSLIKETSSLLFEINNKSGIKQYENELKIHKEEFENLKVLQRKVNLQASKSIQERFIQEKKELCSGGNISKQSRDYSNKYNSKEDILKTSVSLTETLKRTRNFMNAQVSRSSDLLHEINEASKVVDKTLNQQKEYGGRTTEAKSLLTKLKRRDLTDKLLIYFGLLVFFLVVLYIFKARVGFKIGFPKFLSFFYSTPSDYA